MTVHPDQYNEDALEGDESIEVYDSTLGARKTTPDSLQGYISRSNVVFVTEDYTALVDQFLDVTCSTVDITITLPAAGVSEGKSVYITKADATVWKVVVTGVKDIEFQNSTMHLISNGVDWKIS